MVRTDRTTPIDLSEFFMATQGGPPPHLDDQITPIYKWAVRAIAVVGTLLGALFAWVQLRTIPLPLENADPLYARRVILAVYYACWIAGTTFDVNVQKEVYRLDPLRGNVPLTATLAVMGLFVVGAILLWASDSDERTTLALGPFLVVNVIAWRVLLVRVRPIMERTRAAYEGSRLYHRTEQLDIIISYLTGWWQWIRFAFMGVIVLFGIAVCFDKAARAASAQALHALVPAANEAGIANLLPVAALFLFVVFAEGWIWALRVRNVVALRTLDAVARKYSLTPQR
jgi:hypothetical protein